MKLDVFLIGQKFSTRYYVFVSIVIYNISWEETYQKTGIVFAQYSHIYQFHIFIFKLKLSTIKAKLNNKIKRESEKSVSCERIILAQYENSKTICHQYSNILDHIFLTNYYNIKVYDSQKVHIRFLDKWDYFSSPSQRIPLFMVIKLKLLFSRISFAE